jgi:glycine oxidase
MKHPDVLIVGGGVIGLTTAWYLSAEGVRVALVEQGEVGKQASWAGAGIIPPGDPACARTSIDLLRAHSSRLYPHLSRELLEHTGIDNGYLVCGGLELPDPDEPQHELPTEDWHSERIDFECVDRAGLQRLWPGLSPHYQSGAHLPQMAQVRNPRHLRALRSGCEARGVSFLTQWPVSRLLFSGSRVHAVEGERGRLDAGQILLAAGAWSESLLAQVGHRPGIRPIRGEIALLNIGPLSGRLPILLVGKRYIVPRQDGRLLVGSTEDDAGFDARPTAGGIAGLLAFATDLVPSLKDAHLEQSWAGLRPGSADGLPYLGLVPGFDNLHVAAGHFRAGLQLSPATGLVMMQHLLARPTLLSLHPFRLDRPPCPAGQTAFRS